MSAGRTMIFN